MHVLIAVLLKLRRTTVGMAWLLNMAAFHFVSGAVQL